MCDADTVRLMVRPRVSHRAPASVNGCEESQRLIVCLLLRWK